MQWRLRVPILCTSNLKLYIWLTNLIRATRKAAINNHMRKCFGLTTCWHFCWLNLYALHCYKSSVQENLYTYYKDELKNDSNKNCYQMKLFKLRSNGLLSASNGETIWPRKAFLQIIPPTWWITLARLTPLPVVLSPNMDVWDREQKSLEIFIRIYDCFSKKGINFHSAAPEFVSPQDQIFCYVKKQASL